MGDRVGMRDREGWGTGRDRGQDGMGDTADMRTRRDGGQGQDGGHEEVRLRGQ